MTLNNFLAVVLSIFIISSVAVSVSSDYAPEDLIVEAGELGKISGTSATTAPDGSISKEYIQFRGIPYATIPERFTPSVLREGPLSNDTFTAESNGLSCFQPFSIPPLLTEDCLFINVYTAKKFSGNETELRPVIFFIHGGAFTVGQGGSFSALRIINRDVVYVSFNYRLGILGFYSLQNEDIPGNAGMYDVINALKWTNRYIKYFGGNPNLITIAGQSAGSVTVTQLMASPMARGLFSRAIAASGSALNAWGTTPEPLTESLRIAEMVGCYNSTTSPEPNLSLIAQCMRLQPPMSLVDTLYTYQVEERRTGRLGFSVVSPVVQNFPMTKYPAFMAEHPRDIFTRGSQANVPLLMGATKHDGSYVLGVVYNRFLKDNGLTNDATFLKLQLVPAILKSLGVQDVPSGIYEIISSTYLGEARHSGVFNEMYPGLMDIFSVFFFKGDCYQTALLHSKLNDTYWYSFDFKGSVSLFQSLFNGEVPPFSGGITHTDDLIYLYSLTFSEFNERERRLSSRMLDYWAEFAASGNPTPPNNTRDSVPWPVLNKEIPKYLIIDEESYEAQEYSDSWVGAGLEA